jgi:hypothetical protein
MPSNRVVTYIDMKLNSAEEYWSELLTPNVKAFHSEPSLAFLFGPFLLTKTIDWVTAGMRKETR